jgi:hypothetical protein
MEKFFKTVFAVELCFIMSSCAPQSTRIIEIPRLEAPQDYYAAFLEGKRVGYSVRSRTAESDKVVTEEIEVMRLNRLGSTVSLESYTKHVENTDGGPIAFEYLENTDSKGWLLRDSKCKAIRCSRDANGVFVGTKSVNGKTKDFELDWPEDLVLSEGWRLLLEKTGLREGEEFSCHEIMEYDPLDICSEKCRIGQTKQVSLLDEKLMLTEVHGTLKSRRYGRFSIVKYCDKDLNTKKIATATIPFTVEVISCSRELALNKVEKVDIIEMAMVQCPVPLYFPAEARQITYILYPTANSKFGIPSNDNQTVQQIDNGALSVTVHPVEAPKGVPFPYKGDDVLALRALKSNELIQCDNESILALSRKAVGDSKDTAEAVNKIKSFVNGYIKPSAGTSFASALEIANERRGDCTEYAVLTVALCRAAGIPARVVAGYVYADDYQGHKNVFLAHSWAEAYVGGKWIGLDSTPRGPFGQPNTFTAGHIALSYTDIASSFLDLSAVRAFKIAMVLQD